MATKPPVIFDDTYHKPLAPGDTLAYAPQIPALTGAVNSIAYTQDDFAKSRTFPISVPRGPVAHAHGFIGQLLVVAHEKVPVNWDRVIYFNMGGRIGALNPFNVIGMPLTLSGSSGDPVEPFVLPAYATFAAGSGDAVVTIGYEVLGYSQVADGASIMYQLLGNYLI